MTARRKAAGRGPLVILALILAGSAALRLGSGVGVALANAPDNQAETVEPSTPGHCPAPPLALAEALTTREGKVAAKEAAINDRMAALALAETAIQQRLTAMQTAEANLAATLSIADEAAEKDIVKLTAVYESMKPKDAAALFTAMDPAFAAGFLTRMQPGAAGAIMAGMAPDAAYGISVLMAGRNARAPTE
jgi:flagellar motility protein MotE (MotC chaperone)